MGVLHGVVLSVICLTVLPSSDAVLPPKFWIVHDNLTFQLYLQDDKLLIDHSPDSPSVFLGTGTTTYVETLGNFIITDRTSQRLALTAFSVSEHEQNRSVTITLWAPEREDDTRVNLSVNASAETVDITGGAEHPDKLERLWLRLHAEQDEAVFGGGEQYTYFNLRGRNYPIWTREQGILRDPTNPMTWIIDLKGGAGGSYHTTYWPQASFMSSREYYFTSGAKELGALNFTAQNHHEIYTQASGRLDIKLAAGSHLELIQWTNTGRQVLPDWVTSGVILATQGGTETMLNRYQQAKDAGVKVAGIWIQDWAGQKNTTFGQRLFWNWRWNDTLYPGLDEAIQNLDKEGVKVLAYINPHLNVEGDIYRNNTGKGYFLTDQNGDDSILDFGGFRCVTVDFLSEAGSAWYEDLIRTNLLDLGFAGWMADFSEYVPVDAVSAGGDTLTSPAALHNTYPALWGRANRRAVAAAGKENDTLFFVRAGSDEQARHVAASWSGDQNTDWTLTDGLATTIVSALSLAVSGCGVNHFDIGGYTTQHPFFQRSEELLLRSAEYAAFTPIMRNHEGNQPASNVQWYSSERTLSAFARLSRIFTALVPYTRSALDEYHREHTPLQVPTFVLYPDQLLSYTDLVGYQYLYGPDLLVAPVYKKGATSRTLPLPADAWVHLWTGQRYTGPREITVDAPLGQPPVFYRVDSKWVKLFEQIGNMTVID